MKIAYNPKTAAALTIAPKNNDITFDLRGLNIFVRGEKFKGTDTTYSVFKKHTSAESGGYNGLVPVPSYTATNVRFLREDGTWSIPAAAAFIYTQLTNQDLDDYLDEGRWYYAGGGNTTTNKPSGVDAYELYVGRNASGYRYLKLITSSGLIWFRYHDSSAWKTWVRWYTDMNTDLKVLLSATTTSNYRPLALGYTNTSTTADLDASVTLQVYVTTTIYAQPSTGSLWANKLYSGGKPVLTEHQSLANYVTLNTAQTISGVKTFSTQLKFTVALGTAPFTVTSNTKVTNLNSDLLDGYDSGRFLRAKDWVTSPGLDADTLELNMMCFTYSNNAPHTGTIIYFSGATGGDYGLLLNASYLNPGYLSFRSRNGDNGTWKDWSTILTLHNYTNYINTTNFPGLNKVGTVTQVIAGTGISVSATTAGQSTYTVTNAGVRATTINGNYLRVNTNGTNADLTIPYATTSGTAAELINNTGANHSTAKSNLRVKWFAQINNSSGYAGTYGFPVSNNANGILWLGTRDGHYGGQLGVSSNNNLYYRFISNNTFTANSNSWKKLVFSTDLATVATTGSYNDLTNKPTILHVNAESANYLTSSKIFYLLGSENYNSPTLLMLSSIVINEKSGPLVDMQVTGTITFTGADTFGIRTSKNNYVSIGEESKRFYRAYINLYYGFNLGSSSSYFDRGYITNLYTTYITTPNIKTSCLKFAIDYIANNNQYSNLIYETSNDNGAQSDTLANLVIKSWNGVSFTSDSGSFVNKTNFGIDCRTGNVKARGTITASAFYESSDERLKIFDNDINIDFNQLKNIPKKYFNWKSGGDLQIGTSAQEIQKLYPELVKSDNDGYLKVAYDKLSIISLAAIDKLYDMISELKEENKLLKKLLNNLKN